MAGFGASMGLAENPFYKSFDRNRGALVQGFASIGADPMNPANGFSQGFAQGNQADQARLAQEAADAKAADELNQTTQWLQERGYEDLLPLVSAGKGDLALSEAMRRMQPGYGQGDATRGVVINGQLVDPATGAVLGDYRDPNENGGGTEFGLTPIWGQMPDGTFGYGVQGKDGTFRQVDTGELNPLDPRSLAGERAFGTQLGTAQGQGAASAAGDISNATAALDILDQIETSPELPWATGTSAGMGGNKVPGTGRYGFQNLVDQAKSGAFLSAIQQMRGMGALSNAEGQVATAAITRMDTALSETDFKKALADYRKIIQTGLDRATGRVGMQPNVNAPTASPTGQTSSGLSWSVSQ